MVALTRCFELVAGVGVELILLANSTVLALEQRFIVCVGASNKGEKPSATKDKEDHQ